MSGYLYSSLPLWPLLLYSLKIISSDILKVDSVCFYTCGFLAYGLYLGNNNLLAISTLLTYYCFPLFFISMNQMMQW